MEIVIASRDKSQIAFKLEFKIIFKCVVCNREVQPDQLLIGRAHIYAVHCKQMQEVGIVA
jgi:transcription elongation factor Elf1